jgi:hypothetical protein
MISPGIQCCTKRFSTRQQSRIGSSASTRPSVAVVDDRPFTLHRGVALGTDASSQGASTNNKSGQINVRKSAAEMSPVPRVRPITARPGGSTRTSRARRCVSRGGTPRRARVPPVDYRDGLSPSPLRPTTAASCLTPPQNQNIIHPDPQGHCRLAGFKSERWPASSRNGWPASNWNAWPASSESAPLCRAFSRADHLVELMAFVLARTRSAAP